MFYKQDETGWDRMIQDDTGWNNLREKYSLREKHFKVWNFEGFKLWNFEMWRFEGTVFYLEPSVLVETLPNSVNPKLPISVKTL